MPTPSGLPKPGEIWQRTYRLPEPGGEWKTHTVVFKVFSRSTGSYWSMHVDVLEAEGVLMSKQDYNVKNVLWVDAAYWLQQGELKFIKKDDGTPWAQQRRFIGFEDQQAPDKPTVTRESEARWSLHRKLITALKYAEVLYCDQGKHEGMLRLELRAGIHGTNVYLTADEAAEFQAVIR